MAKSSTGLTTQPEGVVSFLPGAALGSRLPFGFLSGKGISGQGSAGLVAQQRQGLPQLPHAKAQLRALSLSTWLSPWTTCFAPVSWLLLGLDHLVLYSSQS